MNIADSIPINIGVTDMTYVVNRIIKTMPNGGAILSLLLKSSNVALFNELYKQSQNKDLYKIISLYLDYNNFKGSDSHIYNGHYSVHYLDIEKVLNNEYSQYYTNKYSFISLDTENALAFTSVQIFYDAVLKLVEDNGEFLYNITLLKEKIHDVNIKTLIGDITVSKRQYIEYNLTISKIVCDTSCYYKDSYVSVDSECYPFYNPPFSPNIKDCSWNNRESYNGIYEFNLIYRVGLLFDLSDTYYEKDLYALDAVITSINAINYQKIHNYMFDYILYDYKNDQVLLKEYSNILAKQEDVYFVIGGNCELDRSIIAPIIYNNGKLFFYPETTEGQQCKKDTLYTGVVPNQYIEPLVTYIMNNMGNSEIYLIGNDNEYSRTIHDIIINSASGLLNIKLNLFIEDNIGESLKYIKNTTGTLQNGGIIICTLTRELTIEYIVGLQDIISGKLEYHLFVTNIEQQLDSIVLKNVINIYLFGQYFDTSVEDKTFYNNVIKFSGKLHNIKYSESAYSAVNIWIKAFATCDSTDRDTLLKTMYEMKFTSGDGEQTFKSSHHRTASFYLVKYNGFADLTPIYSQVEQIDPRPWSWKLTETNGKICDYNDDKIGEKGDSTYITILIIVSLSGSNKDYDEGLTDAIILAVNEINSEGGLLESSLVTETVDIAGDDFTCSTAIADACERGIKLIIGSPTEVCIDTAVDSIISSGTLLFQASYFPGEYCNNNIFFTNREISTLDRVVDLILDPLKTENFDFALIGTSDEFSSMYLDYAEKYIEFKGATSKLKSTVPKDITDLTSIVKNIIVKAPNGCVILFFASSTIHKLVDDALKQFSSDISKYPVYSFTTAANAAIKNVTPFASIQSYFPSINTEKSNSFVTSFNKRTSSPITEAIESIYTGLQLWRIAVKEVGKLDSEKIRLALYTKTYESPEGKIGFSTNNVLRHYLYMGYMKNNEGDFEILYTSSNSLTPRIWKRYINDGIYICDLQSGYTHQKQSLTYIGILTSFSGSYEKNERYAFNVVLMEIMNINDAGGILGKQIVLEVRDCKSNIDLYKEYAIELATLEEVTVVFGGTDTDVVEAVSPLFARYKKNYFYFGHGIGEVCYEYTFTIHVVLSQYVESTIRYIFPTSDELYVIGDNTRESSILTDGIIAAARRYDINYYGPITLEELKKNESLTTTATILNACGSQINHEVLTELCRLGITGTTNKIYSYSVDRNQIQKIDNSCIANIYFLTTFIKEIGDSNTDTLTYLSGAESFVNTLKDSFGNNTPFTCYTEAAYSSILVWSESVKHVNSFAIDSVRNVIYGFKVTGPTGTIEINVNGYANRIIFLARIIDQRTYRLYQYSTTPIKAEAYSEWFEDNNGLKCDWSSTGLGEKYIPESIHIAFIHDYSGSSNKKTEIETAILESYLINDINNNLLNNKYIIKHFQFTSSLEDLENVTASFAANSNISLLFGCRSIACADIVRKYADEYKKLFIFTGTTDGFQCSPYVLNVGSTSAQKLQNILHYYYIQEGIVDYIYVGTDYSRYLFYNINIFLII